MAVTAVNINKTKVYVSKYDNDKNNPTKWHVGFLDSLIRAKIDDQVTVFEADASNPEGKARTTLKLNEAKIELVRFGLKNVENFIDEETGKPVKFDTIAIVRDGKSYNVVSDQILRRIDPDILYELADEIKRMNKFSGEEEKN